ncbi:Leukotriene A-4 hydrolase -like protein [Capsicum chinense]|nr:Leukotriene A-4 hydrolase -like protein [Capsicum chinense]
MEQPIPPCLFAFAVGELGFWEVGPRTRIYSDAVPGVLDAAATEFAGTEEIIQVRERLFGPYEWERFDLLVLPPSFPVGGMEDPMRESTDIDQESSNGNHQGDSLEVEVLE